MASYCNNCGAQLQENSEYCYNCGATNAAEQQQYANNYAEQAAPNQQYSTYQNGNYAQPTPQYPQNNYVQAPVQNTSNLYPVAGVGGFFGRMILFSIPVVGLICCIIMAFAPRNPNVRNHARAYCIFWIIAAALVLLGVIIAAAMGASLFSAMNSYYY